MMDGWKERERERWEGGMMARDIPYYSKLSSSYQRGDRKGIIASLIHDNILFSRVTITIS